MVLTTTSPSSTTAERPARCAETAAASPHGPPPTIRRSTGSAERISLSGCASRNSGKRALHTNDLVTPGADAHVGDLRLDKLLDAIEVTSRRARKIGES